MTPMLIRVEVVKILGRLDKGYVGVVEKTQCLSEKILAGNVVGIEHGDKIGTAAAKGNIVGVGLIRRATTY